MFEQMKELIGNYVDVNADDITLDSKFIEDLGFNSYDFVSLLGEAEEIFDVQIDEQEVLNLHTVGDAIAYIEKLKA
ncbi:MAG: acyl carrier protein [Oscillospiraceae bacterium]